MKKTFLFDFKGQELNTFEGKLKDLDLQSNLLITHNWEDKTITVYNIDGRKLSSIDIDEMVFSRFIDSNKIAIGCKDNTVYIYNITGKRLNTLKGIPINSIQTYERFIYYNHANIVVVGQNGLYTTKLKNDKQNKSQFSSDYLELIKNNEILELPHSGPINIHNTNLKPISFTSSDYYNLDLIKLSSDNKFVLVNNVEYYSDSSASILRILSMPDFKPVFLEKNWYVGNLFRLTDFGVKFTNTRDTFFIVYSNETIKYCDTNFRVIDEWPIDNINYCGFDNYYNNWIEIKNNHLIGYCNSDSSFKLYDYINKDSTIISKSSSKNYDHDKLMFIKDGQQLLYYEQTRNIIYLLSLNLDTLDIIKPIGKKVMRVHNYDDLLFISSIEAKFVLHENNTLGKKELPQSYFQIYDLNDKKTIIEHFKPDVKELILNYTNKTNLYSFINKANMVRRHPLYSYIDIRNKHGHSLIKFETNAASNFSEDGKHIVYFDKRYKNLVVFPLDASEVIEQVREIKEFGNISNLESVDIENYQNVYLQDNILKTVDSNSINIAKSTETIKTKKEFDKLLQLYYIQQDWKNYYLIAKDNIRKYFWADVDELAKISEIALEHTDNKSELSEITRWALQSVALKSYIHNNLLLGKIHFKLDKDKEALRIIENACFKKLLSSDYYTDPTSILNYLYDYYEPENFKKIIADLFMQITENSRLMNGIAWFFYENVIEDELLEDAVILIKRSVKLKRGANNLDTYAALLYKLGRYKEALPIAKEAYELAKKNGWDLTNYEKRLDDIKNELKRLE